MASDREALIRRIREPLESAASYDVSGETVGLRLHGRDCKKALDALDQLIATYAALAAPPFKLRAEAAEAERDRLREALVEFGAHDEPCSRRRAGRPCYCGLHAALSLSPHGTP